MRILPLSVLLTFGLALAAPSLVGCDMLSKADKKASKDKSSDDEEEEDEDEPKKKKTASSAAASASVAAPTGEAGGAMVTIPAGTFKAGHACSAIPRVTDEELVHAPVALGEFRIDVYPYPNDPTQAAKTNVPRDEAARLCQAAGKRLCSELEWERACKGPSEQPFPWGAGYDANACAASAALAPGQRAKCESGFGMKDPFGLAHEWTSSTWGRGKGAGLATVKGHAGKSNVVRERCASGVGRDPSSAGGDVGFRCCAGPENPASVDLPVSRAAVLEKDASVSGVFAADLLRAMPADHRAVDGVDLDFDQVTRWHPRDNEELVVARWIGRPKKGKPFYELSVFKVCGGKPSRIAGMKGPVHKIEPLATTSSSEKITARVRTDSDEGEVTFTYWYGSVKVVDPPFVKAGNKLEEAAETADPVKRPSIKLRLPKKR